jgi:hypothetical protein
MNRFALFVALLGGTFGLCFAQPTPAMSTTSCSFQDGKLVGGQSEASLQRGLFSSASCYAFCSVTIATPGSRSTGSGGKNASISSG